MSKSTNKQERLLGRADIISARQMTQLPGETKQNASTSEPAKIQRVITSRRAYSGKRRVQRGQGR